MYDIEMQEPSPEFGECWAAAGTHLDRQVDGGIRFWLRTELTPPFLEHLSFRLGNQLFFVRLEDVEGQVEGPGTTRGLKAVADGLNADRLERLELPAARLTPESRAELTRRFGPRAVLA